MTEQVETDTLVAGENVPPVNTDTETSDVAENTTQEQKSDTATPSVEERDGKLYLDGVRIYTRDDTNRIASNARNEAENRLIEDLGVESIDQVKKVVSELQQANEGDLNVQALRDAVQKREQTVEELQSELQNLKTEMALGKHVGEIQNAMPGGWNSDQKAAVLDLMKARGMLHLEGDQFAIKNGEEFITDASGENPDYQAAVQLVGKSLGLPFGKSGVATYESTDGDNRQGSSPRALDESRMKKDPAYRSAYVQVRNSNKSLNHGQITDAMVKKQMETKRGSVADRAIKS